jgi:hypothetical protein
VAFSAVFAALNLALDGVSVYAGCPVNIPDGTYILQEQKTSSNL